MKRQTLTAIAIAIIVIPGAFTAKEKLRPRSFDYSYDYPVDEKNDEVNLKQINKEPIRSSQPNRYRPNSNNDRNSNANSKLPSEEDASSERVISQNDSSQEGNGNFAEVAQNLGYALRVANASNNLAFKVYQTLYYIDNPIIAPFSFSTILAMMYQAAGETTKRQISQAMGFNAGDRTTKLTLYNGFKALRALLRANQATSVDIKDVNVILVQNGYQLKSNIKQEIRDNFEGLVQIVNFISRESFEPLDTHVSEKTNNRIATAVPEIDLLPPNAILAMLNVVYFNGLWQTKFNSRDNFNDIFRNNFGQIDATFMQRRDKFMYTYMPRLNLVAVDLPFHRYNLMMTIILPKDEGTLSIIEEQLTPKDVEDIVLSMKPTDLHLILPKFSIETLLDMKQPLQSLKLSNIFDQDRANFKELIDDEENAYVSTFLHRVVLDVNEDGDSASTFSPMTRTRQQFQSKQFQVNHPFLFLIRETRTGLYLLMGKINQLK